ncbi:LAQU0S14e00408g1_1 [Lachancea quebecensis]|uniref:Derlin n=1 Tax=Lachancea quebecensis TaxID=1654605 RepID=A0A0N7MM50_9SACH|nr:LAQU0S14e00408g1_1 [Lachancea quebecensis]
MAVPKKTSNSNELAQVFSQIPPVTRTLLAGVVAMTVVSSMGIVPPNWLYFYLYPTFMKLQLWRMYTSCFLLPTDKMAAVFWMYNLYSYSSHLENAHFHSKNNVDYLFLLWSLIGAIVISVTALRLDLSYNLTNSFMGALACIWSIKNWNVTFMFYGLFPLKGKYDPLFQLFLAFVFENYPGGFTLTLTGYCVGYLYVCLDTRSLGPLYGFMAGKSMSYGLTNCGYFRAPWWFSAVCELFGKSGQKVNIIMDKTHNYQGTGRRLGSEKAAAADAARLAAARAEHSKTTTLQASQKTTGSKIFPGKGQRVGSKD